MPDHATVVQRVVDAGAQIAEQLTRVDYPADQEPDSGNRPNQRGHQQVRHVEVVAPPRIRPGAYRVPDRYHDKAQAHLIDDRVEEDGPDQHPVAASTFRINAEKLAEDMRPQP